VKAQKNARKSIVFTLKDGDNRIDSVINSWTTGQEMGNPIPEETFGWEKMIVSAVLIFSIRFLSFFVLLFSVCARGR
jgi:hypothetical protein